MEMPVEELVADVHEETVVMEEPAEEMVETILGDEYFITEESKSVQEVTTSQEPDYMELLAELQSRFICLQYEFQYNLDKISDFDYEHRYRNQEYITYQSNVSRIMDKSSYINQWTAELAKLGLFQKDLKKTRGYLIKPVVVRKVSFMQSNRLMTRTGACVKLLRNVIVVLKKNAKKLF